MVTLSVQELNLLSVLKKRDVLTVVVRVNRHSLHLHYVVEIRCSRRVWDHPGVRGGKTATWLIGYSRNLDSATRRAEKVIARLNRARSFLGDPKMAAKADAGP